MLGNQLETAVKTILSFLKVCGDWLLERVDVETVIFNLLLQSGWLDYNHLYIFGKSLHQQEYKILRKGFDDGLSKQQISNVFNSQEMLQSPLISIENTVVCVMERYELTFTMIIRIFQIHQHWTLHKRICCCWTTVS